MKVNVSPLMEVVGERLGESASCGGCLAEAGGMRVWLSTQAWWPAPPRSALPMGLAGGGFPDGNRIINCIFQTFTHGNCHFWILKTQMGGACPFTFKSGCFCRTWYMVGVGGSPGQGYPPFQILGCDWSEIMLQAEGPWCAKAWKCIWVEYLGNLGPVSYLVSCLQEIDLEWLAGWAVRALSEWDGRHGGFWT